MASKLSLKYRKNASNTTSDKSSVILSSNLLPKNYTVSSLDSWVLSDVITSTHRSLSNISVFTEDNNNMTEDLTQYFSAEDENEDVLPSKTPIKNILFCRTPKYNNKITSHTSQKNKKESLKSKIILASDSSEDEETRNWSSKHPSILGDHRVILISSESDDHDDENDNESAVLKTPERGLSGFRMDKVEDWLATSPIPQSPSTPARIILSSSSSSCEEDDEVISRKKKERTVNSSSILTSNSDYSSKRYFPSFLSEVTSKGGISTSTMETIDEEGENPSKNTVSKAIQVDLESFDESEQRSQETENETETENEKEEEEELQSKKIGSFTKSKNHSTPSTKEHHPSSSLSSLRTLHLSEDESCEGDERNELPSPSFPSPKPCYIRSISNGRLDDKSLSFLQSLTLHTPDSRRHKESLKYIKNFKTHKVELTQRLYKLYNEEAFEGLLPFQLEIKWNMRLTKTAGLCVQKCLYSGSDKKNIIERSSRIELSGKVLDTPDRLRDTLIHEMCHAAAWIISGYRDGHGPIWKSWAARAMNKFPELPIIDRCHNYQIKTKFTYRCEKCGYSIGRHSKSLDTEKKVCGYCRGKFILIPNNTTGQNTPNKFAAFVKENYSSIRREKQTVGISSHGEVMKELSKLFAETKLVK